MMRPISGWRTAQSPGRRSQPDDDDECVTSVFPLTAPSRQYCRPVSLAARSNAAAAGSSPVMMNCSGRVVAADLAAVVRPTAMLWRPGTYICPHGRATTPRQSGLRESPKGTREKKSQNCHTAAELSLSRRAQLTSGICKDPSTKLCE